MAETILEQTTHTTNVQDVFLLFPPCPNSFRPHPPLTGNAHMETTHFKKGLPLGKEQIEYFNLFSFFVILGWNSSGSLIAVFRGGTVLILPAGGWYLLIFRVKQ